MKAMLSLSRFGELARAYGSDLGRWPEDMREPARALAESSDQARALLEGERALDTVFASFEGSQLSETLEARLQRLPGTVRAARPLRLPRRAWRAPALGWAAAAVLGLWLGTQSADADEVSQDDATILASGDSRVVELADGTLDDWDDIE